MQEAVAAFRQALALDPDYAEAYSGLAMAESFAVESEPNANLATLGKRRAMAAAERALALDPELGDAYGARGYLRGTNDLDWNGAEADLLKVRSVSILAMAETSCVTVISGDAEPSAGGKCSTGKVRGS
jgi:tetratricopeptide (TPR) repeat protein